jgi:hypothetical protein
MDLLDRYLQAVKKHLPWQRQDDILAELRANLESQLEDKEAGLGRPLTDAEAEAWLKEVGPPLRMASRYQAQQYLIGPAIFPTYWFVLRMAFFWALIVYSVVAAVRIAGEAPSGNAVLEAALRAPGMLMTTAAWVTLVFASIEFAVTHSPASWQALAPFPADWSPGTLPPLEREPALGRKQRSHAHAVAEVVFGFLLLGWLLLVPQHPYLLLGPGAAVLRVTPFQLAPVWVQFFWWVVGLSLLQLGWRCVDLWRGSWQEPRTAQRLVVAAFGLIPLLLLLGVGDHSYLALKHPAVDQARYGETLDSVNMAIHLVLRFAFAITVLQLLWTIGRMVLDLYRKQATATR